MNMIIEKESDFLVEENTLIKVLLLYFLGNFFFYLLIIECYFWLFFFYKKKWIKRDILGISQSVYRKPPYTQTNCSSQEEEFLGKITDLIQTIGLRHQSKKEKQAPRALHTIHDHAFTCDIAKISIWSATSKHLLIPMIPFHSSPTTAIHTPPDLIHTFLDPTHPKA